MSPPTLKELKESDLEDLLDNLSGSLESLYEMFRVSDENLVGCPNEFFYFESTLNKEIQRIIGEIVGIHYWAVGILREIRSA